jgi:heme oxygenase
MEKRETIPEITFQIDYDKNFLYLTVNIDVIKNLKSNIRTAVGQHTFSLISTIISRRPPYWQRNK